MTEHIMNQAVLALVNGELWDMHRPLTEDCELSFLHFRDEDPRTVNKVSLLKIELTYNKMIILEFFVLIMCLTHYFWNFKTINIFALLL